jgi:hypothetical protein
VGQVHGVEKMTIKMADIYSEDEEGVIWRITLNLTEFLYVLGHVQTVSQLYEFLTVLDRWEKVKQE